MLSEEQRQALHARLSEGTSEPAPAEEQKPDASEGGPADTTSTEVPAGGDQVPEQKPETGDHGRSDKQVPLDKHVRVRQERNTLRQQLQEAKEQLARLEGFKEANAGTSSDQEWLDKVLGKDTAAQEPANPLEERLSRIEKMTQEVERREGQVLLNQVLDACVKKDSTVPRQFLVDAFAAGETPEQAIGRWQTWTQGLRSSAVPAQAKPPAAAAPAPPPTVSRVPPGPPSNKPQGWKDVSSAVRQALGAK